MDEQEGTRSTRTGEAGSFKCAAMVEYRGRKGACRRDGKYPDIDGIRWWCGLHKPDRKAKRAAEKEPAGEVEVVVTSATVSAKPQASDRKERPKVEMRPVPPEHVAATREVLVMASQAQVADEKALEALEEARSALIEISNTNTVGWDETKPVENYKILIDHMAGRAREASEKLTAVIRDLRS